MLAWYFNINVCSNCRKQLEKIYLFEIVIRNVIIIEKILDTLYIAHVIYFNCCENTGFVYAEV